MANPNTVATADFALKQNYTSKIVKGLFSRDFPTLGMIEKRSNTTGNQQKVPLLTSDGGGVSSDYVSAAASAKGVGGAAFMVEMADFIGVVPLHQKLLKTAEGDGSFLDWLKTENDAKINAIGRHVSTLLFGNGGGAIAQGLTLAGNVLTLTKQSDAMNLWEGQQISASANDGSDPSHTLRSGGTVGYLTVASVDRDAGKVTFTAVTPGTDLTGYVQGDYLFLKGSFAGNVSASRIFKGFGSYFTSAAPTDTLWNVARTGKPELSGFRIPTADQVGGCIQRIRKGAVHGNATWGATPKTVIVNPKQWEQASISLQNQGYRDLTKLSSATGQAGYRFLEVTTGYGVVELISDPHCDPLRAFFLDLDTLAITHLGSDIVEAVEREGLRLVPSTTDVGFEVRYTSYCNLICNAPWRNGSIPLAAI